MYKKNLKTILVTCFVVATSFILSSNLYAMEKSEIEESKKFKTLHPRAIKGEAKAQYELSVLYREYNNAKKSSEYAAKAGEWLLKSAEQNYKEIDSESAGFLVTIYEQMGKSNEVEKWFKKLTPEGQYIQGITYIVGNILHEGTFIRDIEKAKKCFSVASERGNKKATDMVEVMCKGKTPDDDTLLMVIGMQLELGGQTEPADKIFSHIRSADSLCSAAMIFELGQGGVPKNIEKAKKIYSLAANRAGIDANDLSVLVNAGVEVKKLVISVLKEGIDVKELVEMVNEGMDVKALFEAEEQ